MSEVKTEERGYRKTRRGYVVSDKMDKTVVVEVEDRVKHALYGKVMRRSSKIKAHDEQNTAGIGDLVLLAETRPLSASKHWRVKILDSRVSPNMTQSISSRAVKRKFITKYATRPSSGVGASSG